jgi:threonine dehydrogenase-like Zn-dependent dehydrogenase
MAHHIFAGCAFPKELLAEAAEKLKGNKIMILIVGAGPCGLGAQKT